MAAGSREREERGGLGLANLLRPIPFRWGCVWVLNMTMLDSSVGMLIFDTTHRVEGYLPAFATVRTSHPRPR
jgi:hypothetical protein